LPFLKEQHKKGLRVYMVQSINNMAKGKGYKLTSATGDGTPKTCAFFFSDQGCRNGDACKFSHTQEPAATTTCPSATASVSSSSVCSSESDESDDGEIIEKKAGAYASLANGEVDIRKQAPVCVNPFLTAVAQPTSTTTQPVATQKQPAVEEPPVEKKKKKRKKNKESTTPVSSDGGNIFDLGKAENQNPPVQQQGTAASILASVAAVVAPPPQANQEAVAIAAPPAKKKQKKQQQQQLNPTNEANNSTPNFRNLQLPIASFSLPTDTSAIASTPRSPSANTPTKQQPAPTPPSTLPLPTATPSHLKWKNAVIATRQHTNYTNAFNYQRIQQLELSHGLSTPQDWITCRTYNKSWCTNNIPSSIAIDCEMCETKDPISGKSDTKALCRISIVNGDNPSEVLLDTLVKPQWPVTNHRTFVNGITEEHLKDVKFTLKHAQAFMLSLCSDQTVIVGHAVHNDLLALRMVHHVVADTAMLYTHGGSDEGTPSLKNVAHGVLKREMPDVHDSVNDARVAYECAQHYITNNGKVDPIEKVYSRSNSRKSLDSTDTAMLLVHRLPTTTLSQHITEMFIAYTYIKPKVVPDIIFSGTYGKCHVEFTSREHAELAYNSLVGDEREDKTGKKQKRVSLKGGGYVCVRKMKKGK